MNLGGGSDGSGPGCCFHCKDVGETRWRWLKKGSLSCERSARFQPLDPLTDLSSVYHCNLKVM